jgi:hypothetical protein
MNHHEHTSPSAGGPPNILALVVEALHLTDTLGQLLLGQVPRAATDNKSNERPVRMSGVLNAISKFATRCSLPSDAV